MVIVRFSFSCNLSPFDSCLGMSHWSSLITLASFLFVQSLAFYSCLVSALIFGFVLVLMLIFAFSLNFALGLDFYLVRSVALLASLSLALCSRWSSFVLFLPFRLISHPLLLTLTTLCLSYRWRWRRCTLDALVF
jgi:hypothetical protein